MQDGDGAIAINGGRGDLPEMHLKGLRHAYEQGRCLFIMVERNSSERGQTDAIDPTATLAAPTGMLLRPVLAPINVPV